MDFSNKHIDYLSRAYLDEVPGVIPGKFEQEDLFIPKKSSLALIRLSGLSHFWEPSQLRGEAREQHRYRMEDVLIGCHGAKVPLLFYLRGLSSSPEIEIDIGTLEPSHDFSRQYEPEPAISFVEQSLPGHYPGIQSLRRPNESVSAITEQIGESRFYGIVSGLPTVKVTDEKYDPTQLDRLIRTMYGSDWGYLVVAQPVPDSRISSLIHSVLNEMRLISNAEQTKATWAPLAKAYHDMLDVLRKEFEDGRSSGLWAVTAYYFSSIERNFHKLGAAIRAHFGGEKSTPDPIRTFELPFLSGIAPKIGQIVMRPEAGPGNFVYPFRFQTLLTSARLAILMHLPRLEVPGFTVKESCHFDVVSPQEPGKQTIKVGEVLHYGRAIGNKYVTSVNSLQKHALIVGVTGSGKTNTAFYLLIQLWELGIPFLVLEPAKTEYRSLLTHGKVGDDVRVFTLGGEQVSPLRMNPFEVEPGISVSTHIDLLKSVFNASFGMWTPLPQVLERCIHEIYRDRGWDPTRNINYRLEAGTLGSVEAFPTLTDLYEKIEEVVTRLGYEERVESDIKAALMTRINSLRIGSKGIMLDTHQSMPVADLLNKPAIIELEQIGDDDEKAFLMGLLMTRIYEYLRSHGSTEGTGLKHIVVIEEAHRLLANVPQRIDIEQSNVRFKAVETFTNMLSEVRAYGEGFIVAEQIPVKLSPDVIKNTNLKIVHRIVAGEDRRLLAETMNMDQRQSDMLTVLKCGEAVVFVEGDDKPIMVGVPYAKIEVPQEMKTKAGSDQRVAEHMRRFRSQPQIASLFVPLEACSQVCRGSLSYCDDAKVIVGAGHFQEHFAAFVLSVVVKGEVNNDEYLALRKLVSARLPQRSLNVDAFRCAVLNAIRWYFDYFGRRYNWSYDAVRELTRSLSYILLNSVPETESESQEVGARLESEICKFQKLYRLACRIVEFPFSGCFEICPSRECLFRYHNEMLLADRRLSEWFWEELDPNSLRPAMGAIKQVINRLSADDMPEETQRSVGLCFGLQQVSYNPSLRDAGREAAIERLLEDWDLRNFDETWRQEVDKAQVMDGLAGEDKREPESGENQ